MVTNNVRKKNSFDIHKNVHKDYDLPLMVLDRESFMDRREAILSELNDARQAAEDEHRRILDKLTTIVI